MRGLSILMIVCILFFSSCYNNKKSDQITQIEFDNLTENDTISLKNIPINLSTWLNFYSKKDPEFKLSNFKASGVILHMLDMKKIDTLTNSQRKFEALFEFSPNKKRYIDIWTYGQVDLPDSVWNSRITLYRQLLNGEPDQQVVLGEMGGSRYEIMYNGPANLTEIIDWINDDQFLISLTSNEQDKQIVELFVFDIKQKIFTNFRLNHSLNVSDQQNAYLEFWIQETDKLIK
jgi:hypothetical protein